MPFLPGKGSSGLNIMESAPILHRMLVLVLLAAVSFVQNMAFTWTSRSRNSADPNYHRKAAWCSNGIWFLCYVLILKAVWGSIERGEWWFVILAGLIYVIFTAEGSVLMMKVLLKREKGKHRVGAKADGGHS